jgi:uncharacterized membrane protein
MNVPITVLWVLVVCKVLATAIVLGMDTGNSDKVATFFWNLAVCAALLYVLQSL